MTAETELGAVSVSARALQTIVAHTLAESYGVVGSPGETRLARLVGKGRRGRIRVVRREDGLVIDLHVVVEHGLNLAEVAASVRSRVAFEVGRHTGLPVAAVEVHIDDVRTS